MGYNYYPPYGYGMKCQVIVRRIRGSWEDFLDTMPASIGRYTMVQAQDLAHAKRLVAMRGIECPKITLELRKEALRKIREGKAALKQKTLFGRSSGR